MNRRPQTTEALLKAIKANPRGRYQEWADAMGVESTSTVRYHLQKLAQAGLVRLHPGRARSVEIIPEGDSDIRIAIQVLNRVEREGYASWNEERLDEFAAAVEGAYRGLAQLSLDPDDRPLAESV